MKSVSGRVLVTFAALALITGACSPGTGASVSLKAIGIDGASYRLKEAKERSEARRKQRAASKTKP